MKADELWEKFMYQSPASEGDFLAALKEYGELVKAKAVKVIIGGRFLHDDAPDAKWAKSCAAAISKMELP